MPLSDSDLDFTVWAIMDVPPARAYEAVADPAQLQQHFTMGGAQGRMQTDATVTWEFADFPGPFEVDVIRAEPPRLLEFDWGHPSGQGTNRVTFTFDPVEDVRCKVSVAETGWTAEKADLQAAYGNCMG
ncbi:SRPBCC domain-containing protein [Paracoccus caeni]|uniref:SRPBCC domain-containing protein n=1 Tax=Paracoccus caeni TaxID=657651 RepID=A0A934W0J5_9RHOB|nr:SRPBCC domain-containing protein [Paracoccus caeni]MBK4217005.1 SRPBCC domain-containing protein [Paracoccus caeni]